MSKKKIIKAAMESDDKFENGLKEALFPNTPPGQQLSQPTTIIENLRYSLISNLRTTLSWSYVEIGLIQTICNIPVQDALKGGLEIHTGQLEQKELEELEIYMEEKDDIGTLEETAIWNRLYGGSGTLIVTDEDPRADFNLEEIKKGDRVEFKAADLWELFWAQQYAQSGEQIFNPNKFDSKFFSYYGLELNKSRVMTMKGIRAPSFLRPTLRGWGCSVVETLIRSINQYLKSNDLIFEVLDEFKIDVYKIKNLSNTLLQPSGTQKIMNRIQIANMQKNFQNAVTMDSEDDFLQKELSFAGISETLQGVKMHVASDMRIPITKLFGVSAAGFNSGEDDIENYNAMIESTVRPRMRPIAYNMVKIRCQELFGFVPDDLRVNFKPLRILSSEQEESVKTSKHQRLMSTWQAGGMTTEEFKEACNKDKLLPVQLDTSIDRIEVNTDQNTKETSAPNKSTLAAK